MNPYESRRVTTSATTPPSPLRLFRNASFFGLMTGFAVWTTLYIAVGFDSEFGMKLTRVYGRDLIDANMDWVLLIPITVVTAITAFLATATLIFILAQRLNRIDISGRASQIAFVGVPTFMMTLLVYVLCQRMDAAPLRPVLTAFAVTLACSFVSNTVILRPD